MVGIPDSAYLFIYIFSHHGPCSIPLSPSPGLALFFVHGFWQCVLYTWGKERGRFGLLPTFLTCNVVVAVDVFKLTKSPKCSPWSQTQAPKTSEWSGRIPQALL